MTDELSSLISVIQLRIAPETTPGSIILAVTLKNAFIFGISHIAMTVALVIVDAVFVALLVASWFYMPGGLFLLVILGYGTMLMLHIPVTERVFNPYLID